MFNYCLLLLLIVCHVQSNLAVETVDSHISGDDLSRLQKVFEEEIKSNDLQSIYYSSLNYNKLADPQKREICSQIIAAHSDSKLNDFEKNFYLIGSHKKLGCSGQLPAALKNGENLLSKEFSTSQEMYFNLFTAKELSAPLSQSIKEKLATNLKNILKKDDSLSGLGHAFLIGAELGHSCKFILDRVEDVFEQADLVDGKMMQFEGGLSLTALIVNGALKLTKTFSTPIPKYQENAVKFATYFLSRRSVQTAKGAHALLEALRIMAADKGSAPVCIQIIGNAQLQADSPTLNLKIIDLLGAPLSPPLTQVYGKIVAKKENSVLAEKVEFTVKSSDKTVYSADLSGYKPTRNLYVIDITAKPYTQTLLFKVLGKVKVHSLEVGVGDSDSASALKKQSVLYPSTLKDVLNADHTQKVAMKVVLTDASTTKVISVHQAFVRFANKETDEEIIFVAEQDSTKVYKFDMDIGSRSADFGHKSGLYKLELIVGDAAISNSFRWHVADIQLKFFHESKKESSTNKARSALPEIVHKFREPEIRPPRIVSDIFTGFCLTPLVLLLILWAKLGINVANFSFSLSGIGFHLGFGAILSLFGIFWLQLNMFETLHYLIPIAIFTFLCGNKLLRTIAIQKHTH